MAVFASFGELLEHLQQKIIEQMGVASSLSSRGSLPVLGRYLAESLARLEGLAGDLRQAIGKFRLEGW